MAETNHKREKLVETQSNACDLYPDPSTSPHWLICIYWARAQCRGLWNDNKQRQPAWVCQGCYRQVPGWGGAAAKICLLRSRDNSKIKVLEGWLHPEVPLRIASVVFVLCLYALLSYLQRMHVYLLLNSSCLRTPVTSCYMRAFGSPWPTLILLLLYRFWL